MNILLLAFAAIQSYLLWQLWRTSDKHASQIYSLEVRLYNNSHEPKPQLSKAKQILDKEIEGFNPKKPTTVLPRSEEERKARVYTNWEIDSDYKIVG
jgi:hypothetical protein